MKYIIRFGDGSPARECPGIDTLYSFLIWHFPVSSDYVDQIIGYVSKMLPSMQLSDSNYDFSITCEDA